MREVVINTCYGGYSLSAKAVKRLAELQGRECYFFESDFKTKKCTPAPDEYALKHSLFLSAYDVPNPDEVLSSTENWSSMSEEERRRSNEEWNKHTIDFRPSDREDPLLLQVVKELGEEANGDCAELKIVEIPDGIDYEIEEYDGVEWISETHKTWR